MPTDHTSTCKLRLSTTARRHEPRQVKPPITSVTLLEILGASRPLPPSKHSGGKYQYVPAPCSSSHKASRAQNARMNRRQHQHARRIECGCCTWLVNSMPPPSCSSSDITFDSPKSVIFACNTHACVRQVTREAVRTAHLAAVYKHIGGLQVVVYDSVFLIKCDDAWEKDDDHIALVKTMCGSPACSNSGGQTRPVQTIQ